VNFVNILRALCGFSLFFTAEARRRSGKYEGIRKNTAEVRGLKRLRRIIPGVISSLSVFLGLVDYQIASQSEFLCRQSGNKSLFILSKLTF